jgi:hypothetical protein
LRGIEHVRLRSAPMLFQAQSCTFIGDAKMTAILPWRGREPPGADSGRSGKGGLQTSEVRNSIIGE